MRSLYRTGLVSFLLLEGSLVAALALYYHCAWLYANLDNSTYYSLLAQAFLSGHTYLLFHPSPELLALANPYDPAARAHVPLMWDTVLYQGHYYLYYGPVPALLSVLVKWLTGIIPNDRQLAFFFSAGGTYYLAWLSTSIFSRQPASRWGAVCAVIAICFGTWIPLMLCRPSFYEVAISGAYCFMALGLMSLWHGVYSTSRAACWKLFGSLCFGLAAGCRIFHGLNAVILFALWLTGIKTRHGWKAHILEALYLTGPWSLCMAGLVAYNYARFGSIFESGVSYQLTLADFQHYSHFWQLSDLWPHFYEYFLKPLPSLLPWQNNFGRIMGWDKPYGLWTNNPFSLWSLWFIFRIHACKRWLGDAWALTAGVALYSLGITLFVLLYHFDINRFMVDFSPWVMLLAALGYLDALLSGSERWRPALLIVGGIMALWSVYTAIASSYCGFWSCG